MQLCYSNPSSNFGAIGKMPKYYFNFLEKYNINSIINSYGYYEKLDKFYSYELGLNDISIDNVEFVERLEIKMAKIAKRFS